MTAKQDEKLLIESLRNQIEMLQIALSFSNLYTYEDYIDDEWTASNIQDALGVVEKKIGSKLNYEKLFEHECHSNIRRLAFAHSIAYGNSLFSEQGIEKFVDLCIENEDTEALLVIQEYLDSEDNDTTDKINEFLETKNK